VKIAINAGKSKILEIIAAAVNFGNDVLNMERRKRRIILMQMTILASVLSTLTNLNPDLCADHLRMGVGDLLRLSFEDGDELIRSDITRVFGAFIFREFAFRRSPREFFDSSLQISVGTKTDYCVGLFRQHDFEHRSHAAIKGQAFRGGCHAAKLALGSKLWQ
jgi:hypothetical protein